MRVVRSGVFWMLIVCNAFASSCKQVGLTSAEDGSLDLASFLTGAAANGGSGGGSSGGAVNAPGAPQNLTVTARDGEVILRWDAVDAASSYNIYWSNASGLTTQNGTKIAGAPTLFSHGNLTNGSTYYYIVTAKNSAGESAATAVVSATPSPVASGAPGGITAVAGLNQVTVSWSSVSGATSYNLYWATSTGLTKSTGTKIAGITGNSYTHVGLANGATYYYILTAANGGSESSASAEVGATPQVSAPANVLAVVGDGKNTLRWDGVAGVTTYNIYWSLTPTVSKSSNKIASVTSPYNHTGLSNGTAYYYAVTANNAGGESALSAVVTATPQSDVTIASTVWGHDGEFTIDGADNAGVSRYSISAPRGIAPDGSGGFYVADGGNHRVLHFPSGELKADRIYGQSGSSVTATLNKGGVSASSLNSPYGVTVSVDGVYIADYGNHRVLYYPGTSTTATRVYGQGDSFATNTSNAGGVSAISLSYPQSVAVDAAGVYISDGGNNRVLYYSGTSTTATRVYGQAGSFSTATANNGGVSANSLSGPRGIFSDGTGLYVAEGNNRVLYYAGTSTTATRVYGQGGSFVAAAYLTKSADSLYTPYGVAADAGGVYIADSSNNRLLYYAGTSTTATRVYGQAGSFTAVTVNNGGLGASSISGTTGVAVDAGGVYIADTGNNRVLYYAGTSTTATTAWGPVTGDASVFNVGLANYNGVTRDSLDGVSDVAVDAAGGVYAVDTGNHRVLYFPSGATSATRVYGQMGSFTSSTSNKGGSVSADTLAYPTAVDVDSTGVYIADSGNNRVLWYDLSTPSDTTADRVYGQSGSMTTNAPGVTADKLYLSYSVGYNFGDVDASPDGVYILDGHNNRVLYYPGTSTTATRVYGQWGAFTTGTANKGGLSAGSLNFGGFSGYYVGPRVEATSGGVYISDRVNNRVLFFEGTSTTATRVYGQYGFFTSSGFNYAGISAQSLYQPGGLAVDSSGSLYVADQLNHRILYYPAAITTATRVYGQGADFAAGTANNGGVRSVSLSGPLGLALSSSGALYVADEGNNRVLKY